MCPRYKNTIIRARIWAFALEKKGTWIQRQLIRIYKLAISRSVIMGGICMATVRWRRIYI